MTIKQHANFNRSTYLIQLVFRSYLFWMLIFAGQRALFLLFNQHQLTAVPVQDIILSFLYAWKLDTSTACYLLVLPALIAFAAQYLTSGPWLKISIRYYTLFFLTFLSFLISAELNVFEVWQTKLSYSVMRYVQEPELVMDVTSNWIILRTIFLSALQIGFGYLLYLVVVEKHLSVIRQHKITAIPQFLVIGIAIAWGIRGGLFQMTPITQSVVYFSKHPFINTATVNSHWNLIQSIENNARNGNGKAFEFMPHQQAEAIINPLLQPKKDTTTKIIQVEKPNVMIFLLEGYTSDLIESLGGYAGATPFMEELIDEGYTFTNCLSSAVRTEQGISAVLSGYPAQPRTAIIGQIAKHQNLPSITEEFQQAGYWTSFHYGGELSYINIKAWMYSKKLDLIIDDEHWADHQNKGGLGFHEEYVLPQLLKDLNQAPKPFCSAMLTVSTHDPFDNPKIKTFKVGRVMNQLLDAAYYTDAQFKAFFQAAKKQEWYKNTLFVFVADHARVSPREWPRDSYDSRLIPIILYGDVLKKEYQGVKDDRLVSQIDITKSLLHQVSLPSDRYPWSKDMFNPTMKEYAYSSSFENIIWSEAPDKYLVYDINENKPVEHLSKGYSAKDQEIVKAYSQLLMQDYNRR